MCLYNIMRNYANMARCGGVYCGRGIMAEFNAKEASLYYINYIYSLLSFFALTAQGERKKNVLIVLANSNGQFCGLFIGLFLLLFEACGHEKNEFSCSCGRGGGARVPTWCRRGAAGAGGAVVVVLV